MCTAVAYHAGDCYFGRNLDLDISYGESVVFMPRGFSFPFRKVQCPETCYSLTGMAIVVNDCPLYYDAVNEKGLGMAGLNFPGNADYKPEKEGMDNVTPFELIPWILRQCANMDEVKKLLKNLHIVDISFSKKLPLAPLHWFITDGEESLVLEAVKDGLRIYDDPAGVLTNNPVFPYHMEHLNHYMGLSADTPVNTFSKHLELSASSLGMGSIGLPGDYSSPSRFVRAAFVRDHAVPGISEGDNVNQFFHILDSVAFPRGCVRAGTDKWEYTIYSCCCNLSQGIYYYITYGNRSVNAIYIQNEDPDGDRLITFPLITEAQINKQDMQKIFP